MSLASGRNLSLLFSPPFSLHMIQTTVTVPYLYPATPKLPGVLLKVTSSVVRKDSPLFHPLNHQGSPVHIWIVFFFFFLSCKSSWYILDKWTLLRSFRSLIHFELIFVHCVPLRKASQAKRRIKTHECHPTPCSLHRHWELWARGSQTLTCASHRYLQPQNQLGNFQNSNIQMLQILMQDL